MATAEEHHLNVKRTGLDVDKYFRALVKLAGSDLHMKAGKPPYVRVKGALNPLNHPDIDEDEMERLLMPMLNARNLKIFEETGVSALRNLAAL